MDWTFVPSLLSAPISASAGGTELVRPPLRQLAPRPVLRDGYSDACAKLISAGCNVCALATTMLYSSRRLLDNRRSRRRSAVALQAMPTPYGSEEYYTRKARSEGKPARSYYKLEQLDKKLRLLVPGAKVMDLGCAPGSWTLFAADKVGPKGRVLGLDLKAVKKNTMPGNVQTRVQDAFTFDGRGVPPLDVLLSDMAPDTIQDTRTNALRSAETVRQVIRIADFQLREGGSMIAKLFDGPDTRDIMMELRRRYETSRIMRPDATRNQSPEIYVIGLIKRKVDVTAPTEYRGAERERRRSMEEEGPVQAPDNFGGW